jgi:hypothetical protein
MNGNNSNRNLTGTYSLAEASGHNRTSCRGFEGRRIRQLETDPMTTPALTLVLPSLPYDLTMAYGAKMRRIPPIVMFTASHTGGTAMAPNSSREYGVPLRSAQKRMCISVVFKLYERDWDLGSRLDVLGCFRRIRCITCVSSTRLIFAESSRSFNAPPPRVGSEEESTTILPPMALCTRALAAHLRQELRPQRLTINLNPAAT